MSEIPVFLMPACAYPMLVVAIIVNFVSILSIVFYAENYLKFSAFSVIGESSFEVNSSIFWNAS